MLSSMHASVLDKQDPVGNAAVHSDVQPSIFLTEEHYKYVKHKTKARICLPKKEYYEDKLIT